MPIFFLFLLINYEDYCYVYLKLYSFIFSISNENLTIIAFNNLILIIILKAHLQFKFHHIILNIN